MRIPLVDTFLTYAKMGAEAGNATSLKSFLASISSIKGDLSNITAPPFILGTESTVQFPRYWAQEPAVFTAPSQEPDPQLRSLLVLKWFLSVQRNQGYGGRAPEDGVKKPLNAILGELYLDEFRAEGVKGVTRLVSEQVSHHPPVTACCLWNDECGIRAEGYIRPKVTFNGSVHVKQIGRAILHLSNYDEHYLIPLPDIKVKGILSASPYPEMSGTYYIHSTSGYTSEITFKEAGLFSGEKHAFEARLYAEADKSTTLYTVKGSWETEFTFYKGDGQSHSHGHGHKHHLSSSSASSLSLSSSSSTTQPQTELETYRVPPAQPTPGILPATNNNNTDDASSSSPKDPWESQMIWHDVIQALVRNDMAATSRAKSIVEQAQRERRKREAAAGEVWKPLFFAHAAPEYDLPKALLQKVQEDGAGEVVQDLESTAGAWKFERGLFEERRGKAPYRGAERPVPVEKVG